MLWKKESTKESAMYVDFCGISLKKLRMSDEHLLDDISSTLNKNDSVALQKRMIGNELFRAACDAGKLYDAINMYNESLCFAEPKSSHISLAYANRSSCFLKLKRYNECLIDIDLAIEAGYPENLLQKLEKRKHACLEAIKTGSMVPTAYEPKLSFEPDETYPYLANAVNFQRGENGKYSVVAKENIDVGQTIAIEEAFTTCLHMRYGSKCTICLKNVTTNLIPCKKCTIAMFCSDECQRSSIHEYECGVVMGELVDNMENVRSILKAIGMFANVDELMNFVEENKKDNATEPPANITDAKLNYREFLRCRFNAEYLPYLLGAMDVYPVYKILMDIPKVGAMFNTQRKRRFLMHLIAQHSLIKLYNSQNNAFIDIGTKTVLGDKEVMLDSMTGVIHKYFGHSCAPNVHLTTVNNKLVYYTLRPIKRGEPLRISVSQFLLEPKEKRQKILLAQGKPICKCERCEGPSASKLQRKQLASDPDYIFISTNMVKAREHLQEINEKCVSFLTKYGRMTWCSEIGEVVTAYTTTRSLQWSTLQY